MDDWAQGYMDGRDLDCPQPGDNQSPEYRHSFDVGRREVEGRVASAASYRRRVEQILKEILMTEMNHRFDLIGNKAEIKKALENLDRAGGLEAWEKRIRYFEWTVQVSKDQLKNFQGKLAQAKEMRDQFDALFGVTEREAD